MVAKLAYHNLDQFLRLCGDLFDEILALLILGQNPKLPTHTQQQIILHASERAYSEIPQRRSHGQDIQRVLSLIETVAEEETHRPADRTPASRQTQHILTVLNT